MLLIQNNQIVANSAPNIYEGMKPWTHECGPAWWLIDPNGILFTDSDGTIYHLHKRTQTEMAATPEYQAWITAHADTLPVLYVLFTSTIQAGSVEIQDDGIPLMPNDNAATLRVVGTLRAGPTPDDPIIPHNKTWPIRLRRSDGSMGLIVKVSPQNPGVYQFDLKFKTKLFSDRYRLLDSDFAIVTGADGQQYQIKQAAQFIVDVYEAS